MKTLKFKTYLIPLVLSGEKTATWRLFDDKNLQVGDVLSLLHEVSREEFAKARVIAVIEKKLGELTEQDFEGHEKYESTEKMYEEYRSYYGDIVGPDSVYKIVTFELI